MHIWPGQNIDNICHATSRLYVRLYIVVVGSKTATHQQMTATLLQHCPNSDVTETLKKLSTVTFGLQVNLL